jgi:hypothetical protein
LRRGRLARRGYLPLACSDDPEVALVVPGWPIPYGNDPARRVVALTVALVGVDRAADFRAAVPKHAREIVAVCPAAHRP